MKNTEVKRAHRFNQTYAERAKETLTSVINPTLTAVGTEEEKLLKNRRLRSEARRRNL